MYVSSDAVINVKGEARGRVFCIIRKKIIKITKISIKVTRRKYEDAL